MHKNSTVLTSRYSDDSIYFWVVSTGTTFAGVSLEIKSRVSRLNAYQPKNWLSDTTSTVTVAFCASLIGGVFCVPSVAIGVGWKRIVPVGLRHTARRQVATNQSAPSGFSLQSSGSVTGALSRCDSNTAKTISIAPRASCIEHFGWRSFSMASIKSRAAAGLPPS